MKTSPAKSSSISDRRCTHVFANGKRCRDFTRIHSHYCHRHTTLNEERREADDISAFLTSGIAAGEAAPENALKSPSAIHDLLSRLLLLLAQDRISPRRAAVLFYGSGLLLRATAVMQKEAEMNKEPTHIEYVLGYPFRDCDKVHPETPRAGDVAVAAS